MIVAKTVDEYRKALPLGSIGFVPTMGALHEGHLSLLRSSKSENQNTVVSIFVNPLQFGPSEDFSKYPRPFEQDVELVMHEGVDILFAPSVEAMYPQQPVTVHVPGVSDYFDGLARPGHFDGVATIVAKLFNIVRPSRAYFGEKDLQQCAVIRKLINDLDFPIELIISPTCREKSGLAMSSRNKYLSTTELQIAPVIYSTLGRARDRILAGESPEIVTFNARRELEHYEFSVDYLAMVNRNTLSPISVIDDATSLIVAARLGTTRLIDNVRITG